MDNSNVITTQTEKVTFNDLKLKDKYNAFEDFDSVIHAKEVGIIPDEYLEFFPEYCECGAEVIISKSLTQVQCCDPRCKIKMGYMLSEMLDRFGCRDIGPATCLSVMNEMKRKLEYFSPIEMLNIPYEKYPLSLSGAKADDFQVAMNKIRSTKLTLAQLVAKLGVPTLEENGRKLFEAYESIIDLVKQIKLEGGIENFMHHRDVKDRMKMFYLDEFIEDIGRAQVYLQNNIRLKALSHIDICITGSVFPKDTNIRNKQQFVEMLNDIATASDGKRLIEINKTEAIHSVDYLVADANNGSRKYKIGVERGILISSTELMNKIREVVQAYEQQRAGC